MQTNLNSRAIEYIFRKNIMECKNAQILAGAYFIIREGMQLPRRQFCVFSVQPVYKRAYMVFPV